MSASNAWWYMETVFCFKYTLRKIINCYDYVLFLLDAVKLQVLDNLLFVLDTEVGATVWFSLHFTVLSKEPLS